MIEITGDVPPVQPGGVKHFRKVLGGGGESSEIFILVGEGGESRNFEVKIKTA